MKGLLSEKRAQTVLQEVFKFFEFRNTVLSRGVWRMKWKGQIEQISTKNRHPHPRASGGHCPLPPDIVRDSKNSPTASRLRELYIYPLSTNGYSLLATWNFCFTSPFSPFLRPQTLNPRIPTQSSWSRDWVKPRSKVCIWISSSSSSWHLNLHAPRFLLLELCS
jgi:hypothetical protein